MLSSRNRSLIPNIEELKLLTQSLAMLDAIMTEDWQYRYFSFEANWAEGINLFTLRTGTGDDMYIVFMATGTIIKGFAHESSISPYQFNPKRVRLGMFDGLPKIFLPIKSEPSLAFDDTTFCLWRTENNSEWQYGYIPEIEDIDGSKDLMRILDGKPSTYRQFALVYFEKEIELSAVQAIYQHQPLNKNLIDHLNSVADLDKLRDEANRIAYPVKIN